MSKTQNTVDQPGDEKLVALFDDWHASSQLTDFHDTDEDRTAYDAAYERCSEIEAEIMAAIGGAKVGDIKVYFAWHYLRLNDDKGPDIALLRYPELFEDEPLYSNDIDGWGPNEEGFMVSLLRDGARRVPKIAELAAPIVHDDAALIETDLQLQLYHDRLTKLVDGDIAELPDRLKKLLERIAKTGAKTPRGEAIKAKYAVAADLLAAE
jgi:hypothetical protein